MFHTDVMYAIAEERGRERRAEAQAARDARRARRARAYWAEQAELVAARLPGRRAKAPSCRTVGAR
ncbi:hypothetical protein [Actinomadura fibrosa]|uniref:Uncharacterized protein n=1 Tax=Actinomadura fibrosa TaxID=111802 RepID=A0ABW2XQU2_9ACTN|nr:hypothetical protein [Actinomadura fibrosa]